jgi:NAD(P)-dependent dehydrogenase (short-subunit alcohol dehydrogenase family)
MPNGRSIFITGSSSGIGLATAKLFHDNGWQVAATMRNPHAAPDWMKGPRILALRADVTDQSSLDTAFEQASARFGKIDVAFCNAGYGLSGPVEGATDAQIHRQFDVNVVGVVRTMKAVLPSMRKHRSGTILVTSSVGGRIGMPVSPLYIASKHAVEGLIESARFELAPFCIQVKLIEPGGIRTDFSVRSAEWTDHPAYEDAIAAAKKMSVDILKTAPEPSHVAKVVLKAATDRSRRLRYLAKPGPYVAMYQMLPDRLWSSMIQLALKRASRAT